MSDERDKLDELIERVARLEEQIAALAVRPCVHYHYTTVTEPRVNPFMPYYPPGGYTNDPIAWGGNTCEGT